MVKTSRRNRRIRRNLPDANLASLCDSYSSANSACKESFCFLERIKLIRQIAERHADNGDDDVGNSRPPLENFDEEFQAKVVDENITDSHKEISDYLRPAT